MIDNINGLLDYVKSSEDLGIEGINMSIDGGKIIDKRFSHGSEELFCPECSAVRKCKVNSITNAKFRLYENTGEVVIQILPVLLKAKCLQCDNETLLLLYQGPKEVELAILHNNYGGCVTPNSPYEVKYYIDQAYRSRSVGAISASMAMYRSALEWILYEQGYKEGMLGKKINDLEKEIQNKTAPKWAVEINTEFLQAIKEVGNGAMHTNGGDITKQDHIDKELIELIDIVFFEVLDKIYEQPIRENANLSKLRSKVMAMKK